jgi:hypothetical protein
MENVIQRLVVLGNEKTIIEKNGLNKKIWPSLNEVQREAIKKAEPEIILKSLEMTNWSGLVFLTKDFHILLNEFGKGGNKFLALLKKKKSGINLPLFPNIFLLFTHLLKWSKNVYQPK